MSMSEWARHEVALACKFENPDRKEGEWDYGCSCYESALKAYLSLLEDGHSGMSFGFTRNILIRLMEGKPLTPIEDTPENWRDIVLEEDDGAATYQSTRMNSLFKTVHADGSVTYSDADRYYCIDMANPNLTYRGGGAGQIVDEYFPIVMPYNPPSGHYKVYTREYLTDRANGDYDTKEYCSIVTPNGITVPVYRYFGEFDGEWKELSKEEFDQRIQLHNERILKEASENGTEAKTDPEMAKGDPETGNN